MDWIYLRFYIFIVVVVISFFFPFCAEDATVKNHVKNNRIFCLKPWLKKIIPGIHVCWETCYAICARMMTLKTGSVYYVEFPTHVCLSSCFPWHNSSIMEWRNFFKVSIFFFLTFFSLPLSEEIIIRKKEREKKRKTACKTIHNNYMDWRLTAEWLVVWFTPHLV